MLPKILENNLSVPVVGAPLFIISRPQLVIAQCKAGIVGSFPALNARPQELLSDWINQIKDELGQFKEENPGISKISNKGGWQSESKSVFTDKA